ncbi:MAG: serine hydrolase domain-containing protein [Myxococcota bacterium]|nr:serine hydrolase domain-containing protein [Myxococcota bacterium]
MLTLLLACTANNLNPKSTESDTALVEIHEDIDQAALLAAIESDVNRLQATAFSMAIIREGEVVWQGGVGNETPSGTPVTENTRFRVASITKPMTAVVTLQQVEAGCLRLDSPVDAYLDNFGIVQQPQLSATLTVADTLKQTGGLLDNAEQSGENGDGQIDNYLPIINQNAYFLSPPGRMYNYSNTNIVIAGALIEDCTDTYFRPQMAESLWEPLEMSRTAMATDTVLADQDYALGISTQIPNQVGQEVTMYADTYSASHLWPAMGAWSTAADLAKFAQFLMHGDEDILASELLAEMTTMQIDTEEGYPEKGYGYGIEVKKGIDIGGAHYPVTMLSHSGSLYGYSSHFLLIPELDVAVIALINREEAVPTESVSVALNLAALVDPVPFTVAVPAEFSDYEGEYYNENNIGEFILTDTEEGLHVSVPAFDDASMGYEPILQPVRPDNFRIIYDNGSTDDISFIRNEEGDVEYLRNRYYVGLKME